MRFNIINRSIANVVCRFSVVANDVLAATSDPRWFGHLQPVFGPVMPGTVSGIQPLGTDSASCAAVHQEFGGMYEPSYFQMIGRATTVTPKRLFLRLG
jgi:hypothetical protein